MIFSFTHTQIGTEIVLKYHEGIKIAGLMEKSQSSNFSRYSLFKEQGMNVSWDGSKDLLHHKVFIIDNKTVITGSFNPSNNADKRNDENIIIIHDQKLASRYLEEFAYVWQYNDSRLNSQVGLLLSEIYYDATGHDTETEFVEIYNP